MTLSDIEKPLIAKFTPTHLEVLNESSMHSVPEGSLTHIRVIIISPVFAGNNLLERHRAVYNELSTLMQQGLHAVSVLALTPEEWQLRQNEIPISPPCHGGRKREHKE